MQIVNFGMTTKLLIDSKLEILYVVIVANLIDCFFNGALAEGSNPNWFQQARHLSYRT